ncbi:1-pyrroline-5-carboxylate dehydrogenase, partial [Endogone sp. FLAS-F59071]
MALQTPQLANFRVPAIENEPSKTYAPNSAERELLLDALAALRKNAPYEVPCFVNGEKIETGNLDEQRVPSEHRTVIAKYHQADKAVIEKAIKGALIAKAKWEAVPFNDRAAIFLKAADLLANKYRYKVLAATMLGQGKNAWQAEIDAADELIDFWRFNTKYAEEIYSQQPPKNAAGVWNRVEYRALEGFVFAVSPFNFTAIGGNLAGAPALMGNVVLWKPSPAATLSNWFVYEILIEAGLPAGVIQFVPGPAPEICEQVLASPDFASLHFTGSTHVFRKLWKDIGNNIENYRSYPRIVGETGGKNFHVLHKSLDRSGVHSAAVQTIRGAFEYQGQKCSAASRVYVPDNLSTQFQEHLLTEHAKITVGPVEEFGHFVGPVINKAAFDKIKGYIDWAKADPESDIIAGGTCECLNTIDCFKKSCITIDDDSKGYFIHPTIIVSKNPLSKTMVEEVFGPVLTIYVYQAEKYEETLQLVNDSTQYALTGSLFAKDREAIVIGSNILRNAAGNFYINDKATGAVVGQQPFGGGRGSGTNDKAGSWSL